MFFFRGRVPTLAAAAGGLSLSGAMDSGNSTTKDWHGVPHGRTTTWWSPLLTRQPGNFVACEGEKDVPAAPVSKLTRRKSSIATAEMFTQKQSDIAKHVSFEQILGKSELMKDCPPELIKKLVDEVGTKIFARRGVKLISQDEINDKLIIVGHGKLVIEVDEHRVAEAATGDCVGEQAVLTLQKAKADVSVASSSAYLLVIDKAGLNTVMAGYPELVENMLSVISRREVKNLSLNLLTQIPSFDGCSDNFMEAMADGLKLVSFNKGDAAVKMNEADDHGMYFIMTGDMGVYDAKGLVATLGPNDHFGEAMLLSGPGAKRAASVYAESFVEAFQLPRKDFLKVGTKFPKDLEQMKKLSKERSAFLLNRKTSVRVTG